MPLRTISTCCACPHHAIGFCDQNPSIGHPKAERLLLTSERVVDISATSVRCSVLTSSGRVATWVDDTLGDVGARILEQAAIPAFAEVGGAFSSLLVRAARANAGVRFLCR